MCFTINIHTSRDAIEKRYNSDASSLIDFEYRYFYRAFDNPSIPVITNQQKDLVQLYQWGLIPHWVRTEEEAERIRRLTYNARGESIHEKPAFRSAHKNQRCIVIASGFFEWEHRNTNKIPWYISLKDEELMSLAGLFSIWNNPGTGEIIESVSIVTTHANQLMERIHNSKKRMPVILDKGGIEEWLSPPGKESENTGFLSPFDQDKLKAFTISKKISGRNTDPFDPDILHPEEYPNEKSLFD